MNYIGIAKVSFIIIFLFLIVAGLWTLTHGGLRCR